MDTKLIDAVRQFTFFDLLYAIFLFLGTLAPGFLILVLYEPVLIRQLETAKLCLFCFALTAPVLLVNCILTGLFDPDLKDFRHDPRAERPLRHTVVYSAFISFAVLYAALAVAWLAELTPKAFLAWTAAAEILLLALAAIKHRCKKRQQKQQLDNNPLG